MRAAIYARVNTAEQTVDNQLLELRRYAEAREWTATEYVDVGVSSAKDRRPELDRLIADAKRRKFDVLVLLAPRPPRSERPPSRDALRGAPSARHRVRVAWRGRRRDDARRQAAAAHPRGVDGVRTRTHSREGFEREGCRNQVSRSGDPRGGGH